MSTSLWYVLATACALFSMMGLAGCFKPTTLCYQQTRSIIQYHQDQLLAENLQDETRWSVLTFCNRWWLVGMFKTDLPYDIAEGPWRVHYCSDTGDPVLRIKSPIFNDRPAYWSVYPRDQNKLWPSVDEHAIPLTEVGVMELLKATVFKHSVVFEIPERFFTGDTEHAGDNLKPSQYHDVGH